MNIVFRYNDRLITVPGRFRKSIFKKSDSIEALCKKSRDFDGYVRESALEKLVLHDLDAVGAAYVLAGLCDYLIEISSLPEKSTPATKKLMKELVANNPSTVSYMQSVTISYWNEYYSPSSYQEYDKGKNRTPRFAHYSEYPPYKFLNSLM